MEQDQFKERIGQIFRDLDAYTYYDLLNLKTDASADDVRKAFHRMALSMHPDRHRTSEDQELKEQLYAIYKRVSEGYRVLQNHSLRQEYDECLKRDERRLVKTDRPVKKRAEHAIQSPQAKKFFRMAETFERSGDLKNAKINYKFALDMESESDVIQAKIQEIEEKLASG